jgi:hypothetical protein
MSLPPLASAYRTRMVSNQLGAGVGADPSEISCDCGTLRSNADLGVIKHNQRCSEQF